MKFLLIKTPPNTEEPALNDEISLHNGKVYLSHPEDNTDDQEILQDVTDKYEIKPI